MLCQSILLTLWLLKSPLTHFWLFGSLPSHVWFSGNPCCAVYTCSCPVWANWACLTSWPPQPSLEQSASLSCTGASGCPVGGVRDIELCWRALLLCNLYKHMSALMCMCLTLFLASSQLLLVLSLPYLSPSCLSVASCVCTSTSSPVILICALLSCLLQTLLEKALVFGSHSAVPHSSSKESSPI